jgi:hypothetical protein
MTQAEERTGLTELREASGGWITDHEAIAMPKKDERGPAPAGRIPALLRPDIRDFESQLLPINSLARLLLLGVPDLMIYECYFSAAPDLFSSP